MPTENTIDKDAMKKQLVALRDSIEDYLDTLEMEGADKRKGCRKKEAGNG